jgi:hypothetical protein
MIQRTKGKTAVVGWGRGMGHKGHMLLASAVIHQAKAINATPIFILSRTSLIDPNTGDLWADTKKVRSTKDDPLTPQEKLAIYQKTFPENAKIFTVADGESGSLNDALANLAKQGFSNVVLVVGADQKNAFQYLVNPSKDGSIPYQQMGLQNLVVMSRQETQAPGSDIEGPRATPMRQVLLDPNVSDEQRFAVWRDAMPDSLSDKEVFDLMQKAQQRLGRAEQVAPPKAAKLKEFIQRVRPMLKEASIEKKVQVLKFIKESMLKEFVDTSGDGGKEDPDSFPLNKFADIIEQYLGRGYTRQDREKPEQVSVKFEPKDKSRNGAILYSVVGKRGEYPTVNIHLLDYEQGFGRGRKAGVAIPKTRDNALKLAELIFNAQLNEFEVNEAEEPYNLPQRHTMDYGMRKTMIHRLAKATDYEISALSLASDEELTDLYKQVFPDQDINEDYLDEK